MSDTVLTVENLSLKMKDGKKVSPILNNISFTLERGGRLGIVGSSGAGKSMTMYVLANLLPERTTQITGRVLYDGKHDILQMSRKEKRKYCSEHTAIILQDSMNVLNPYRKIYSQMEENIRHHHRVSKAAARDRIREMMAVIGINGDMAVLNRYPGQFSGGMRQRIAIAMALESNAEILIADEPTTALDVVNQMNFVRFLKKICEEKGLSLLFISHNLGLVSMLCEDVLVMGRGEIIERGTVDSVFSNPQQAYTRKLVEGTRALLHQNETGDSNG